MYDYSVVVLPDRPPLARLIHSEFGTAEVECVRTRTRLTFEMHFPTQEHQDEFLSLKRSRRDVRRLGGRISVLPPAGTSVDALSQLDTARKVTLIVAARTFGISPDEFKAAHRIAFNAILAHYQT